MSIFANATVLRVGPRPAAAVSPPRAPVPAGTPEASWIAIFDSPARPGETIQLAFRRRERDLLGAFARLTVREAIELHRRLRTPRPGDPMADRFSRLVADRRVRVLTFLADARRRAALARR